MISPIRQSSRLTQLKSWFRFAPARHGKSKSSSSELGLYVHSPFCVHKCGYCDFNSWEETGIEPQKKWLNSLQKQLVFWGERSKSAQLAIPTVFMGGGTPSLLDNSVLREACRTLRDHFNLSSGNHFEWTLECNPETLNPKKLELFWRLGINRLSVGIQSFNNANLERLERRARKQHNIQALQMVRDYWPGRWSMDLMFGLPGQNLEGWEEDIQQALEWSPKHLSAYQLTLTTERAKNWMTPEDDISIEMFRRVEILGQAKGLQKYETSNFAIPGEESRHNLRYWRLEPFLGLGPGAAGVVSDLLKPSPFGFGWHQKCPDRFEIWQDGAGLEPTELRWLVPRSAKDHLEELLMMGLRLREGVAWARLGGLEKVFRNALKLPEFIGFFEVSRAGFKCTQSGEAILDTLLPKLFAKVQQSLPSDLDLRGFDPKFPSDVRELTHAEVGSGAGV